MTMTNLFRRESGGTETLTFAKSVCSYFLSLSTVVGGTESINGAVMTSPVLVLRSFDLESPNNTRTVKKSQAFGPSVDRWCFHLK